MKLREKIRGKLNSAGGYSLAEALICVLLLLLVSGAMVNGLQFALAQYRESMELSQATVLCSTLETKLTARLSEVSYTDISHGGDESEEYPSIQMAELDEDGKPGTPGAEYGCVLYGKGSGASFDGGLLTPAASYTYGMKAAVKILHRPDGGDSNYFRVKIKIMDSAGEEELTSTVFDVNIHG